MTSPTPDFSSIPPGRISKLITLDTALRAGLSFEEAAQKLRVSRATARNWATAAGIRKSDLADETPDQRAARLVS
ncbi:MAG: hypothetical protein WA989_04190, partial [Henriciella sp.]|uniref:hypothetical protein n=1 Tax=Henriciella sp. TaxID=1968823 RepID=UPI003C7666E4